MAIYTLKQQCIPQIATTAYIAESAIIIGKVKLEENSSVWFHVCIRGDNELITVGKNSNIQEGSVLHTDMGYPLHIGKNVTVGHQAMLHGCIIGDGSLIGMRAVVLNGVKIGQNSLVGAGALLTEDKTFPGNSLIIGVPAKVVRELRQEEISWMQDNVVHYVKRAQHFKTHLKPMMI